jgi:hypothetical protein
MKTTMRQLTAGTFIALLLLVGNVNAEGTEVKASGHENIETTLQVEKWMTEEFLLNSNSVGISGLTLENESTIEVESWMINPEIWNPVNDFIEETETGLEMENWMTSELTCNVISTETETKLAIESWMTENIIW